MHTEPLSDNSKFWDAVVATAEHRGLFRLLTEGPRTREEIIAAGIFGPRAYDAIVNALICEGFLVKLDEKLHFTAMGRTFLAKDSQYNWSTTLDRLSDDPLRILTQIERELSNADRKYEIVPRNWRANEPSLADARHFASFMDSKSYAPAATLASIDLNVSFGTKKLLDIGGGSGRYALEISKRQEIECVMLELPVMAEAAKQYCQGMIEVISGDVFERIPEGYDTHLLCDTVHMFEQPDALIILQNCFKALPKGGTILLSNAMLDDSGITPRNSVYFYLSMFVSGAGQAYYPAQFREVLEKAGFINVAFLPYHAHYMLVSARKP